MPVCISVALIGRIPEGGRIRLDHGSRRQSRWIADFPRSRRGSLPEISHFPPHYYTSYLKDGAQIPIRRNLCSSPNPKFLLELTKLYKKRGHNTKRENFCQQLGLPNHLSSVALVASAILDHGHSVDNWERSFQSLHWLELHSKFWCFHKLYWTHYCTTQYSDALRLYSVKCTVV